MSVVTIARVLGQLRLSLTTGELKCLTVIQFIDIQINRNVVDLITDICFLYDWN